MTKRKINSVARSAANRGYKQDIYALCEKVARGDKEAEHQLAMDLEKHTLARWAVKHWKQLKQNPKPERTKKKIDVNLVIRHETDLWKRLQTLSRWTPRLWKEVLIAPN